MNKAELVEQVAKVSGTSRAQANRMLDATIDAITGELRRGGGVTLVGFGSFSVGKRSARTGRNPRTGAPIKIAASKVPRFSAGTGLKRAVNNKK